VLAGKAVGADIKVWWPLDQAWYKGVVSVRSLLSECLSSVTSVRCKGALVGCACWQGCGCRHRGVVGPWTRPGTREW
jgi:hypothetical protein